MTANIERLGELLRKVVDNENIRLRVQQNGCIWQIFIFINGNTEAYYSNIDDLDKEVKKICDTLEVILYLQNL